MAYESISYGSYPSSALFNRNYDLLFYPPMYALRHFYGAPASSQMFLPTSLKEVMFVNTGTTGFASSTTGLSTSSYGYYEMTASGSFALQTYNASFQNSGTKYAIFVDYDFLTSVDSASSTSGSTWGSVNLKSYKSLLVRNVCDTGTTAGSSTAIRLVDSSTHTSSVSLLSSPEDAKQRAWLRLNYDSNSDLFSYYGYTYYYHSGGYHTSTYPISGYLDVSAHTSGTVVEAYVNTSGSASVEVFAEPTSVSSTITLEYSTDNGSTWTSFSNNSLIELSTAANSVMVKLSGTLASGEVLHVRSVRVVQVD